MISKVRLTVLTILLSVFTLNARNYFSPLNSNVNWSSVPHCLSHAGVLPLIPAFDRMEIGFEIPTALEDLVEKGKINPFDPDQISIEAVFVNGAIQDSAFGFYYEGFERDPSTIKAVFDNVPAPKWLSDYSPYQWRVRFTPHSTGKWVAYIRIVSNYGQKLIYNIDPLVFEVTESKNSGFLRLGRDKLHFIESNNRKSFFLIGQDMAWPDGERFRGAPNPSYPNLVHGGYMDIQDWVSNLAYNGGNTIRVVNVPWSYEFEWDTVGKYDMQHAWELDTLFRTCERNGVKIVFCLEHGTYSEPSWYEEHLDWKKHPYNKFLPGIDHPEDFLSDSLARSFFKKKLRYFFARWGYSTSLGVFQILSEMDNWTFNNGEQLEDSKDLQRLNLQWHNEMLSYAKSQVGYRPLLTSTSYGDAPRNFSISAYSSPYVDVVCPRHCYFTQRNDNLRRWGEINGISLAEPGIHDLFPNKPAVIDEMGFGSLVGDPGDMEANTDVTMHNSMWSTAFSGTAGAGLYWWTWTSNKYREQNFEALSTFFDEVDFENGQFNRPAHWENSNRASKVRIETFYLNSTDPKRPHCIGWVHNASYWWGNMVNGFKDRNGKSTEINSKTGDDENITQPTELKEGTKFEVHDLANGAKYTLSWYNTRGAGGKSGHDQFRTNIFGTAKLPWRPGEADWGYKLDIESPENPIPDGLLFNDTIQAGDIITACGNHPLDDGTFTYHWDFGNGVVSEERNAVVIFWAGAYRVHLNCTDSKGRQFRVEQNIVALRGDSVAGELLSGFIRNHSTVL